MKEECKSYNSNFEDENESEDWFRFALLNLSRAYSNDEPQYTSDMIIENYSDYHPDKLEFLSGYSLKNKFSNTWKLEK